jgi:hypothetical protein
MRVMSRTRLLGFGAILAALAALAAIGFHRLSARDGAEAGRLLLAALPDGPGGAAQVTRLHADGTPAGMVTRGHGAPADPIALPDGTIVFSDAVPGDAGVRALYRCQEDGAGATRLTFGRHDDGRPALLADGRVVFERRYRDPSSPPRTAWMTIHPDGTHIALYRDGSAPAERMTGGMPGPAARRAAAPIMTSVVDAARPTGTLLCLDAYASRLSAIAQLPRGAIRKVSVSRVDDASRQTIAEAPVQSDGSFLVEVPADTPLRLTLLGEGDRALASLESGIWVRGNENRGCIGCHEERDLAPPNRRPLALVKAGGYVP